MAINTKDRDHAAVILAAHFKAWFEARARGQKAPEPDDLRIASADQATAALVWLAGELVIVPGRHDRFIAALILMATMISEQGAELEGVLHGCLHPDDPAPKAMVMRLRRP